MRVCVIVETLGIFTYICVGLKMQCKLVPHLSYCRPLCVTLKKRTDQQQFGRKRKGRQTAHLSAKLKELQSQRTC